MAEVPQREYASKYAENAAFLYARKDIPNIRHISITRHWDLNLPLHKLQAILAEMDLWVSEKNKTPQKFVDDPGVNPRGNDVAPYILSGRWRLVANRLAEPGQASGIYQELAYGYLEPPNWEDEATDPDTQTQQWAPLDAEARVLEYQENRTEDAKRIMGIANYYVVIYPNVASDKVASFEAGLTHRPDLDLTVDGSQPRFFSGILPPGTYRFCHADNKPAEDGSASDVIAILCNTAAVVNVPIMMVRNWQQYDWKTYYSGVPVVPSTVLPEDIIAVDNPACNSFPPTTGALEQTQTTQASIYKMTGFQFDREKGLYHIEITHSQGQPWHYTWKVPTGTADPEWYVEFYHQTPTWVQSTLDNFGNLGLAVTIRPYIDEFKTVAGRIYGRTPGSKGHSEWAYAGEDVRTEEKEERTDHGIYAVQRLIWYDEKKSFGASATRKTVGNLGPGGTWQELGGDWYHYKRTTWIYERWSEDKTPFIGVAEAGTFHKLVFKQWYLIFQNGTTEIAGRQTPVERSLVSQYT